MDLSTVSPPVDGDAATRRRARADTATLLHDIRNHLNAVCGLVELMSGGGMRIGTHDAIDVALQSLQTVRAKLDLLRVEPSRRQPEDMRFGEVECVRFVSTLCAAFSPMARRHGSTLSFVSAEPALHARVDALALDRVLSNLVVNAIRHSGASDIEVCVRDEASGIVFLVRDNGIGLPERVKQVWQHLQAGRPAPADYARHGLRSCMQSAALAGARLRLVAESSPGVCWELAVHKAAPAPSALRLALS